MFRLIHLEIKKIIAQKKSWMGILVIFMLNFLCATGFYLRHTTHGARAHPLATGHLVGEFMNANFYTQFILLPSVFMLFPMILAIMGAYLLAGELEVGNLRMVLLRPVSRFQVLCAKFLILTLYSALMLLCLGLVSYAVSAVVLKPGGEVIIIHRMFHLPTHPALTIHTPGAAVGRIFLTYCLALPMLMSVCAMTLMFALATRHFTSAAIITTTVYFCSYIVGALPFLAAIHPYLPTRYWPFWRYALMGNTLSEIPWNTIAVHAGWTAGYTVIFLAIAAVLFNLRDV